MHKMRVLEAILGRWSHLPSNATARLLCTATRSKIRKAHSASTLPGYQRLISTRGHLHFAREDTPQGYANYQTIVTMAGATVAVFDAKAVFIAVKAIAGGAELALAAATATWIQPPQTPAMQLYCAHFRAFSSGSSLFESQKKHPTHGPHGQQR